jgi:hypothetical protein
MVGVLLAAAIALGGCGGSNSSAERTKLTNSLSAQLKQSALPQDLTSCIAQEGSKLPTPQLRDVATTSSSPSPATRQIISTMLTTCIDQGKGESALRALFTQSVAGEMSHSLPAAYTTCVVSKAGAVPPSQLSKFIAAYITQGSAAATAMGHQLGVSLGEACLRTPGMAATIRAHFLAPIKNGLARSHFSAAFKACFLNKAEHISTSRLTDLALHPVAANAIGAAFGRDAAKACIASGAKP